MTCYLTWISHGATTETRKHLFPSDAPLEARSLAMIGRLAGTFTTAGKVVSSSDQATRQTAAALTLDAVPEPDLREIDFGRWAGRSPDEIATGDPAGLAAWIKDPDAAPHGGETIIQLIARIGAWMDRLAAQPGHVIAISPANSIRAAVLHVLRAPPETFRQIDIAPLTVTRFSFAGDKWRLRMLGSDVIDGSVMGDV